MVLSDEPLRSSINDTMLSDWLDHPTAYGAFEGDRLIGFVEGFLEKWNNRYNFLILSAIELVVYLKKYAFAD